MAAHDERDHPTDDCDVTAQRARAAAELERITRQAKRALQEADIDLDLFFLAPNSGDAILIYGTPANPDEASWERVGEIVAAIVGGLIGLRGTRRREVQCATTNSVADHQPQASSVQPTEPSDIRLAHTGAGSR